MWMAQIAWDRTDRMVRTDRGSGGDRPDHMVPPDRDQHLDRMGRMYSEGRYGDQVGPRDSRDLRAPLAPSQDGAPEAGQE